MIKNVQFDPLALIIVSVSYLASYSLVSGFISPLQAYLGLGSSGLYSLLFLPHGVRMLTMFFYRWMGIVYLMPSVLIMWYLEAYVNDLDIKLASAFLNVIACFLGWFVVFGVFARSDRLQSLRTWVRLLISGVVASLFNSLSHAYLYRDVLPTHEMFLGYLIGDIFGQIALMILLIYVFRSMRLFKNHTF